MAKKTMTAARIKDESFERMISDCDQSLDRAGAHLRAVGELLDRMRAAVEDGSLQRRGEAAWVELTHCYDNMKIDYCICTACSSEAPGKAWEAGRYCSRCGRRMVNGLPLKRARAKKLND